MFGIWHTIIPQCTTVSKTTLYKKVFVLETVVIFTTDTHVFHVMSKCGMTNMECPNKTRLTTELKPFDDMSSAEQINCPPALFTKRCNDRSINNDYWIFPSINRQVLQHEMTPLTNNDPHPAKMTCHRHHYYCDVPSRLLL